MKRQEIGLQKKRGRGRPPGRTVGRAIAVRLPTDVEARLDAWVLAQPDRPSLSEAIRLLVERALPKPKRPPGPPGLKRRKRVDGSFAYYWVALAANPAAVGYPLKTRNLSKLTPEARAIRCYTLTAELTTWLAERAKGSATP
jgi:hypothetical protein